MSIRNVKPAIDDSKLVELLQTGKLEIRNAETDPELWKNGRKLVPELVKQMGRRYTGCGTQCQRWTWRIWLGGKRRRIVRAKLVWMAEHLRAVPQGYFVHHGDENRLNDAIGNLHLVDADEHGRLHNSDLPEY